jgi:hypothetical protein
LPYTVYAILYGIFAKPFRFQKSAFPGMGNTVIHFVVQGGISVYKAVNINYAVVCVVAVLFHGKMVIHFIRPAFANGIGKGVAGTVKTFQAAFYKLLPVYYHPSVLCVNTALGLHTV